MPITDKGTYLRKNRQTSNNKLNKLPNHRSRLTAVGQIMEIGDKITYFTNKK